MKYFKDSENVFDVQVEVAMLFETITEIPIGTYTGNAGVPGSQWTLGGGRMLAEERRLAESVRITYNQITSYKSEDPSVYDETYLVEEPFRGDPQGYIEKLKSSSDKGHYDPVVEVGVGIPPPTPPPTLRPKFVFPPTPTKKSGGGDSMLYIIIGVACGGVLIMVLAGGLFIRRRRKSRGLGGAPQMVGNNPQQPPHSIFTGSTPQTMSTGVESGNNSWNSGNMNNMQAVTGVPAAPPPMMMQDREEMLPSGVMRIQLLVPKGKLGMTLENLPWGGPSYVAKVSGKSPLFGRVLLGDKVIAIDGDDVQQVSAKDISKLLARKKKNPQRQITIMRGESKGNDHQMQPNNSVPSGMNNMGNNMGNDPYSRQGSQRDDRGILPDPSNDSLFRSMNNMDNDPYGGMGRVGNQRDGHGFSRSMNNMGNDPYGMGRDGSFRDDRHSNHAFSRSMNYMENEPYGMGREGRQRDDRHFQRSHSISRMNNMDNDPYGMDRERSWRDDRNFDINRSAHGIRGEASWREDRDLDVNRSAHGVRGEARWRDGQQFQRRRTVSGVDSDPYGRERDGSRREDRHLQRNYSVSSDLTMDIDPYRSGREGRQREDRDLDFNHSAPGGMDMDSDQYESGREGGRREGRDFDFNRSAPDDMDMDNDFYERRGGRGEGRVFHHRRSAPGDMNMDNDLYGSGREGRRERDRREDRDIHPRHSAPPLMESEIIDPYSHEGNNHFSNEPFADVKYDAITVIAPRGKLGVVLEDGSDGGPAFVSEIHEDSVLKGEVVPFDRISSIDGQDVKELKAFHISKLLAHKSRNVERKIMLLREKNEDGQNKYMV